MNDSTPERRLPENIEAAMREVTAAAFDLQDIMGRELVDELPRVMDRLKQAEIHLRQSILAALEPKRAFKREVLAAYHSGLDDEAFVAEMCNIIAGDEAADDLTATSSAHEGREG